MNLRITSTLACGLLFLSSQGRADEGFFDSKGVKIRYTVDGRGEPNELKEFLGKHARKAPSGGKLGSGK